MNVKICKILQVRVFLTGLVPYSVRRPVQSDGPLKYGERVKVYRLTLV